MSDWRRVFELPESAEREAASTVTLCNCVRVDSEVVGVSYQSPLAKVWRVRVTHQRVSAGINVGCVTLTSAGNYATLWR